MIKGMAEDILDKCDIHSLPENFINTLSYYRRNGFIIIICASKLINIDEYNDFYDYEYYLNNLSFCGFITLKNILKEDIRDSITDLKKINCKLIITSGDNEYNCLSVGFDSGIIERKNIFVFDKDDRDNRIVIRKIYSPKFNRDFNDTDTKKSSYRTDKLSKQKSRLMQSIYLPLYKAKEVKNLNYNRTLLNSPKNKRSIPEKDIKESGSKKKELPLPREFNTPQMKPEKKIFSEENKNNKTFNVINELFNFLLTKKEELNTLDKKVGDGDIGTGMFNAISKSLLNLKYLDFNNDLKNCYKQIAEDIGAGFGGTSGPLYMSFVLCGLQSIENKESENNIKNYLNALKEGSKMIMKVGKAKVGDRTMIDYLVPMSEMLEKCENIDDLKKVFNDNRLKLLEDIKKLKSKRGRSSYLNGQEVGLDEPGCVLCDFWIKFVIDKLG